VKIETDLITSFQMLTDKSTATVMSGGYYDMFYGHFSVLAPFTQVEMIQPLDTFLARDPQVTASDFLPAATEKIKGKLYGLAWFTNGKEIWYNADLLGQAGVTTPRRLEAEGKWTWDELLNLARQLTRREGDKITVYGFNYPFSATSFFVHSLWAWGADWFDAGFTRPTLDTPDAQAATEFAVDMVVKHRVSGGGDFTKSGLAMQITGSYYVRTIEDRIMKENPFTIEMAPLPRGPKGRWAALANNANYIAQASKAPEQTWLFYKYLLSAETQPLIARLGGSRYVANRKIKPTTIGSYEDPKVYEYAATISRPTPLIARQADFDKDWAAAWKDMVESAKGPREALREVQDKAAIYLRDGCIC
jgi:multiple sugar transport system substrate-binding protein